MVAEDQLREFEARAVTYTGGEYQRETFRYRLLKPKTIAAGTQCPLVLFLHGAGERGNDNRRQIKYLPEWMAGSEFREKYPCFLIAPQCRSDRLWVETPRALDCSEPRMEPGPQMQVVLDIL